jgi:hypothetical protein
MDQLLNTLSSSGSTVTTTINSYDALDRLVSIAHSGAGGAPTFSGTYAYNAANLRTSWSLGDGSTWNYGYDPMGEEENRGRRQ